MKNHQIFDPRKIPRGRSKTNYQLKISTSTNRQTIEDLNSTKENYINKF